MKSHSILIVGVMILWAGTAAGGTYSGGTGEPNDPYQIQKAEDWQELIGASADWSKHFILTGDIDFGGINLTPVAPDTDPANFGFQGISFAGVFDGNDHVLRNAVIDMPTSDYVGLFGFLGSGGHIRNLGVENIAVTGLHSVGGLCGWNESTISYCYATGNVTGGGELGGLCGHNGGSITACNTTGNVTGGSEFGGLCGRNDGTISGCYARGAATGGDNSWYIGGLCGRNDGTISGCYARGAATGGDNSWYIGGLCGRNNGTISGCYATGNVTGGNVSHLIGGLCGCNWGGTISACYATGNVTGGVGSLYLGGLCGRNNDGTISACYTTGAVTGGDNSLDLGGLCGYNEGTIITCFWDIQTSDCNTSAGGTGKTTAEMKTKSTFTDAGWDFVNIWDICEGMSYPRLRWQIPAGDFLCPYGVDFMDFAVISSAWLSKPGEPDWNPACDISNPKDSVIDELDLAVFCENWLEDTKPKSD